MRTGRSFGSVCTGKLVEKPVRGCAQALLVLLSVRADELVRFSGGFVQLRRYAILRGRICANMRYQNTLTDHDPS